MPGFHRLAEGEGFEPPEPRGSTVFKTAAIDHSATPPQMMFPLSGGGRYKATGECLHLFHSFRLKTVRDFMVWERRCADFSPVFNHDCDADLFSVSWRMLVISITYRARDRYCITPLPLDIRGFCRFGQPGLEWG